MDATEHRRLRKYAARARTCCVGLREDLRREHPALAAAVAHHLREHLLEILALERLHHLRLQLARQRHAGRMSVFKQHAHARLRRAPAHAAAAAEPRV